MSLVQRIHHVAYRCHDARETVEFYRDVLGMNFTVAFAEDHVPSTGEPDPYMHVFLDAGGGNTLAFFELPTQPPMSRDPNTPQWVQHIAFEVADLETLTEAREKLVARDLDVIGPTDHGLFKSIYFFDPNGHRLELTCNTATSEAQAKAQANAEPMLKEWSQTKRAPKHNAWLHQQSESQS